MLFRKEVGVESYLVAPTPLRSDLWLLESPELDTEDPERGSNKFAFYPFDEQLFSGDAAMLVPTSFIEDAVSTAKHMHGELASSLFSYYRACAARKHAESVRGRLIDEYGKMLALHSEFLSVPRRRFVARSRLSGRIRKKSVAVYQLHSDLALAEVQREVDEDSARRNMLRSPLRSIWEYLNRDLEFKEMRLESVVPGTQHIRAVDEATERHSIILGAAVAGALLGGLITALSGLLPLSEDSVKEPSAGDTPSSRASTVDAETAYSDTDDPSQGE